MDENQFAIFLNDSNSDDSQPDTQTPARIDDSVNKKIKKKNSKRKRKAKRRRTQRKRREKSALRKEQRKEKMALNMERTVCLHPMPREFTESQIYEWTQSLTGKTPSSITMIGRGVPPPDRKARLVFATKADASLCALKMNQQQIPNTDVSAQCCVAKQGKVFPNDLRGTTAWIAIDGLSKSTTEQNILSHIQQESGVTNRPKSICLVQHEKDKYPGFAVIECANSEDATKCVENLRMSMLCGSKIWCSWKAAKKAFNRKENLAGKTSSILLSGLHYLVGRDAVLDLCGKYGEVKNVRMWVNKSGYHKGKATVTMVDFDAATKAFEGLHGLKMEHVKLDTAYTYYSKRVKSGDLKKGIIKSKDIQKKLQSDFADLKIAKKKKSLLPKKKSSGGGPKIADT